uniref:Uncharacterized protein n=1 Tax=Anguilla anguilla TaxID=7936 RepID=A0A0E9R021_ANGAN
MGSVCLDLKATIRLPPGGSAGSFLFPSYYGTLGSVQKRKRFSPWD